jgi:uncharacterized protein YdhG (YjbR/CyaY superfamily)
MATRRPAKERANNRDAQREVLAKITAMPAPYRAIAERLHAIIRVNAPALSPKVWYGMPAYARDGRVVCFFRGAETERHMTLGFSEEAHLDEDHIWPASFALKKLTPGDEARIGALVKKAAS